MNDASSTLNTENFQRQEATKHSFKTLKEQAQTLLYRGIGGGFDLSLLQKKELKSKGVKI